MVQPEDIIRELVESVAEEEKIDSYDINIRPFSSLGANYMSVLYRAILSSPNRPALHFFAKVAMLSDGIREQVPVNYIYEKEKSIYTILAPAYNKLQDESAIPENDKFKFAKFYRYHSTPYEETLLMEDLHAQGYTMYDRFKPVNWEYASKGVEELAKFHALSIAFKNVHPEIYQEIFDRDQDLLLKAMYDGMKTMAMNMLPGVLEITPNNLKNRLQKFINDQYEKETFDKYHLQHKSGVLVHGDYRASNILFKRQGGKVKNLIPVDYQSIRQGSPCMDLIYFIYCGTDEQFRKLHLKQLINHYYNTFARFLRLLNFDPEQEFSRKEFDEEYMRKRGYGLIIGATMSLLFVDPDEAPTTTVGGGDFNDFLTKPSEQFKHRFIPILNEYVKNGLL